MLQDRLPGMGTPEPQQDIPVPPPYKSKILLTAISVRCCTWKQAVETFIADRAVLPLENSLGGSIHRNSVRLGLFG